jgi:ABC-2 type transport system ATP-binding protein
MDEAERLCDHVAIMDHGRIIALGSPRELIASTGAEHVVEFASAGIGRLDVARFHRIEGVRNVRTEDHGVLVHVSELHSAVPALLQELARQGVALTELRTHSASLEDVFVGLTGRHLREE